MSAWLLLIPVVLLGLGIWSLLNAGPLWERYRQRIQRAHPQSEQIMTVRRVGLVVAGCALTLGPFAFFILLLVLALAGGR